jgi:hypothetical protein
VHEVPCPDNYGVSVRSNSQRLDPDGVIEVAVETTGIPAGLVRAAIGYWAAYPTEIDAMIDRADREQVEAKRRWEREQGLLAG